MSPGATFERVYVALKAQIVDGRFEPGQHLEPGTLSQDLAASITPVRDALHRLVGEGLVETPRGDGFRMPLVTEMGLRHLYRWNLALLELATRSGMPGAAAHAQSRPTSDILELTESLFTAIAGASGNPEHHAAVARLNERLRRVRKVELGLVAGLHEEMLKLDAALAGGALNALRRLLLAYHRKRERLCAEIVEALLPRR
jgi:DNA-binding GntR family transcriptional regulator